MFLWVSTLDICFNISQTRSVSWMYLLFLCKEVGWKVITGETIRIAMNDNPISLLGFVNQRESLKGTLHLQISPHQEVFNPLKSKFKISWCYLLYLIFAENICFFNYIFNIIISLSKSFEIKFLLCIQFFLFKKSGISNFN